MLAKIIETIFSKGLTTIANFVTVVLTAKFLGAEIRGEIALLLLSVNIVNIFQVIMTGASVSYFIPRRSNRQVYSLALTWNLIVGVALSFLIVVLQLLPWGLLPELLIISFLQGLLALHQNVLIGKEKIRQQNLLEILRAVGVVGIIAVFILGVNQREVDYVYLAYIIANTFAALLGLIFIWKHIASNENRSNTKDLFAEMFRFGAQAQTNNISQLLNYRFVYYLIEKWQGLDALGVFSVAVALGEATWVICKSIATNLYARLVNEENEEKRIDLTTKLLKLSTYLTVVALVVIFLLPSELYIWLFGEECGNIKELMLYFSPGILFLAMFTIFNHYFTAKDQDMTNVQGSIIGNVVSVGLGLFLLARYELVGGSATYSVTYALMFLYLFYQYKRATGIRFVKFLPSKNDFKGLGE